MTTMTTTETVVLRALCDAGRRCIAAVTEDRLLSGFEYIDRVALRETLYSLLDAGLVEAVDADWGDTQGVTEWRASRAGCRAERRLR